MEIHFRGPNVTQDTNSYRPLSTIPASGWQWASDVSADDWKDAQASNLGMHMSSFDAMKSVTGEYTGISGYGEGSMMTLDDYGKFLQMLCKRGRNTEGKRVLGPVAWKWMMSPTSNKELGIEVFHGSNWGWNQQNTQAWHMGYIKTRASVVSADGNPFSKDALRTQNSQHGGNWGGYFGTTYYFDVDSGLYWVGQ